MSVRSESDFRARSREVRAAARLRIAELRQRRASPRRPVPELPQVERTPAEVAPAEVAPLEQAGDALPVVASPPIAATDEPPLEAVVEYPSVGSATEPATILEPLAQSNGPADLSALPQIGPGLQRRLAQLGVATLADLADCDPALLARDLGELGRLIRTDKLIDEARSRFAQSMN